MLELQNLHVTPPLERPVTHPQASAVDGVLQQDAVQQGRIETGGSFRGALRVSKCAIWTFPSRASAS
jgi:hypothetical protein